MMFPHVPTSEVLDVPPHVWSSGFSKFVPTLIFPCFGADLKIVYSKFRPFMYNLNSENTSILNSENLEIGKCIKVCRGQGQLGFWAFGVLGSQNWEV